MAEIGLELCFIKRLSVAKISTAGIHFANFLSLSKNKRRLGISTLRRFVLER